MFNKEIEFSAHEDYFKLKEDFPTPIKLNIPNWFKKLEHTYLKRTIKGCIPFLDSLTSGYLLKTPQDFHLDTDVNEDKSFFSLHQYGQFLNAKGINLNTHMNDTHSLEQLTGSPLINKNKANFFYKFLNPWKIKTPKGYSCLFVPPLNNTDDRFSIIPGIVDTDTFENEINFPFVINGDKYPVLKTLIKKGTPYVQVIPFKRDSWKMKLKERKQKDILNSKIFYFLQTFQQYKNKFWRKKTWN